MRQQPLREALTRARRRKQVTYLFQEKSSADKHRALNTAVPLRETAPLIPKNASLPTGLASDVVK